MGLKIVGTLTWSWKACRTCKFIKRKCIPHLYRKKDKIECADYISKKESEE